MTFRISAAAAEAGIAFLLEQGSAAFLVALHIY